MSAATSPAAAKPMAGPSALTKAAAVVVLIALAALAAYAMFSGPTPIPASAVPSAAPAHTQPAPAAGQREPEGETGD